MRGAVLYKAGERSYTIRQETERRGNSSAQDFAFGAKFVKAKSINIAVQQVKNLSSFNADNRV